MIEPLIGISVQWHKTLRMAGASCPSTCQLARWVDSRITEKRRLAIAVPAINARMTTRSRALEFCPWVPPENRVEEPADMVAVGEGEKTGVA